MLDVSLFFFLPLINSKWRLFMPHVCMQVQAKQDTQRSSFTIEPRSLQQLNPKPQSSGTSRAPQSPLPPPQQPVTTVLLHKTSLIDPGVPVTFYTYKGNSSYSKELLPVLFLLNGGNVEATHYSQVRIIQMVPFLLILHP